MEATFQQVIAFVFGMILQLFFLLNIKKFTNKIIQLFFGSILLAGIFALFVISQAGFEYLTLFIIFFCVFFCGVIAVFFVDRIVPTINEVTILLINLVVLYLLIQKNYEWPFVIVVGILSVAGIANAIIPIKPNQWQKLFLFVWYFILVLLTLMTQFSLPRIFHLMFLVTAIVVLVGSYFLWHNINKQSPMNNRFLLFGFYLVLLICIYLLFYFYFKFDLSLDQNDSEFYLFFESLNYTYIGLFTLGMSLCLALVNFLYIAKLFVSSTEYENNPEGNRAKKLEYVNFLIKRYNDSQLKSGQAIILITSVIAIFAINMYFKFLPDIFVISSSLIVGSGLNYYFFQISKNQLGVQKPAGFLNN